MTHDLPVCLDVDTIQIPPELQAICRDWTAGSGSMMYAVSSTGGLTLGSRRPLGVDTNEEWYACLWSELRSELYHCHVVCQKRDDLLPGEAATMESWYNWVDSVEDLLYDHYGL